MALAKARAEARFRNRVAESSSGRAARIERELLEQLRNESIAIGQLAPRQIQAIVAGWRRKWRAARFR